jgi:hypothetical protein
MHSFVLNKIINYNVCMTNSVNLQRLSLVSRELAPEEPSLAREEPIPAARLALPMLDQVAVSSFVAGDVAAVIEHTRGLAQALASAEADSTRLRTVSRALSVCRSQMDLVDAALGQALGRSDYRAMGALGKVMDRLTRRLHMLIEEHRLETAKKAPVQMVIGHASKVTVRGGG